LAAYLVNIDGYSHTATVTTCSRYENERIGKGSAKKCVLQTYFLWLLASRVR